MDIVLRISFFDNNLDREATKACSHMRKRVVEICKKNRAVDTVVGLSNILSPHSRLNFLNDSPPHAYACGYMLLPLRGFKKFIDQQKKLHPVHK